MGIGLFAGLIIASKIVSSGGDSSRESAPFQPTRPALRMGGFLGSSGCSLQRLSFHFCRLFYFGEGGALGRVGLSACFFREGLFFDG